MGKYQGYPEYKETHLEWLREIPNHWEIKRLKYLGEAIIGLTYSPDDVVDSEDEGTLVLRSSNVQNKALAFNDNVFVNKPIPDHLKTRKGDILICARNGSRALIGKNAQIDERAEGMTFGAFMSVFRSPYNDYLSKVFNSALFEYQSGTFLTATINQLTTANLNSFEVPLPPESERQTIANFLDHETAKIDTLIEKQQQLIKLLKEKRQAVISHAVTKGLNPQAPMKDSGVEWLGEVPEHWEVTSIKYQCALIDGDRGSNYPNENDYVESGIPFFSSKNIVNYKLTKKNLNYISKSKFASLGRGKLVHDDLIITVRGTIGHVAAFDSTSVGCDTGFINAQMMIIRPKKSLTDFLLYLSESDVWSHQLNLYSYGSTVKQLSNEVVGNFKLVLPHPDEMVPLLTYLKNIDDKYGKVIDKAQKQIRLMQERRTALISASVTGKIDVRNWQAPTSEYQAMEQTA
ncbi:restriction endonuclease subunit S [Vibrio vulnificus]|nr:restriction endonuclease subunit S [Vibrio vulnificus]